MNIGFSRSLVRTHPSAILTEVKLRLTGSNPFLRSDLTLVGGLDELLVIDATSLGFATPLDLAGIAAWASQGRADGLMVEFVSPIDDGVATYLHRMDLVSLLEDCGTTISGTVLNRRRHDRSDVLLELSCVLQTGDVDDRCASLYRLVEHHAGGPAASAAFQMVGELLGNALDHSESKVGAFVAAQTYSNRREIELAVTDAGIGILAHLKRNPRFRRFTNHETAIKWALKERVSGEGGDRGNGLPDLLRTAAKQGGRLVLRSGFGMGDVRVGQQAYERFSTEHFEIPGTYAWLKAKLPPISQ